MKTSGWWVAAMMAGLGLADAGTLTAQGRGGPRSMGPGGPDRAAAAALRLADELELTDGQRTELEALRQESLSALEALEQETLDARQEMRARMRTEPRDDAAQREALRSEMRERMQTLRERRVALTTPLRTRLDEILSPEQREGLRAELRNRGPDGRWGNRPAGRRGGRGGNSSFDGPGARRGGAGRGAGPGAQGPAARMGGDRVGAPGFRPRGR